VHHEYFIHNTRNDLPSSWLSDGLSYSGSGSTERGDFLAYRKNPNRTMDLRVKPSWCGPFEFDGIVLPIGVELRKFPAQFRVEWTNPRMQVFLNDLPLGSFEHLELARAASAGLPLSVYVPTPSGKSRARHNV